MEYEKINYYRILSMNVARYRKLKGLTQMQLAKQMNISRAFLSYIEAPNMEVSMSFATLIDLAEHLDVHLAKLLI